MEHIWKLSGLISTNYSRWLNFFFFFFFLLFSLYRNLLFLQRIISSISSLFLRRSRNIYIVHNSHNNKTHVSVRSMIFSFWSEDQNYLAFINLKRDQDVHLLNTLTEINIFDLDDRQSRVDYNFIYTVQNQAVWWLLSFSEWMKYVIINNILWNLTLKWWFKFPFSLFTKILILLKTFWTILGKIYKWHLFILIILRLPPSFSSFFNNLFINFF